MHEILPHSTKTNVGLIDNHGWPGCPSPGLALVKLDFLVGTKWGSNTGRK